MVCLFFWKSFFNATKWIYWAFGDLLREKKTKSGFGIPQKSMSIPVTSLFKIKLNG